MKVRSNKSWQSMAWLRVKWKLAEWDELQLCRHRPPATTLLRNSASCSDLLVLRAMQWLI